MLDPRIEKAIDVTLTSLIEDYRCNISQNDLGRIKTRIKRRIENGEVEDLVFVEETMRIRPNAKT